MAQLTTLHPHHSTGERRSVSVPISEKITLCEIFTRTIGRNLPKWAGRMSYRSGEVSLDARLLAWVIGVLITVGLTLGGFGLLELYRLSGDFREQRQMLLNDRQNYINYGIETNRQLQRIENRLDRLEGQRNR